MSVTCVTIVSLLPAGTEKQKQKQKQLLHGEAP
jgi:hypothetical protein